MSGFLRRLRRTKEEEPTEPDASAPEETEAPAESEGEATESEPTSDGEPEPATTPRASRGPPPRRPPPPVRTHTARPSAPAPPEPAEIPIDEVASIPPEVAIPEAATPEAIETDVTPELLAPTPPVVDAPIALPPPLPEADRDAAMSSLSRHRPGSACFLCGTSMQGTFCPTCRMDWNE
jgi:hypothetical protein